VCASPPLDRSRAGLQRLADTYKETLGKAVGEACEGAQPGGCNSNAGLFCSLTLTTTP
jgi:hypothetical protein